MLADGACRQVIGTSSTRISSRGDQGAEAIGSLEPAVLLLRLSAKDGLVSDSSLVLDKALDALLAPRATPTSWGGWKRGP